MIDGTGIIKNNLAEQEITVPGIWDKVTTAVRTGKPMYLCNMGRLNGKAFSPMAVYFSDTGTDDEIFLIGSVYWFDVHANNLVEIVDKTV